jgi:hypothetical protein
MSFSENVGLVVITAAIAGFLVPTVKAIMDQRRFKEQKRYEADLARQSSIITAQVDLLEGLSTMFWEYMLGLIEVSYYTTNGDDARAADAYNRYQDNSASRFGRMQAEISKARRLVSSDRCDELQRVYGMFLSLDVSLMGLARSKADRSAWVEHHRKAFDAQGPVSKALALLA